MIQGSHEGPWRSSSESPPTGLSTTWENLGKRADFAMWAQRRKDVGRYWKAIKSRVGEREIFTQRRVIAFFQDALGYAYHCHWKDRPDNRFVEQALPTGWRKGEGYSHKGKL